jgi:hypothetical protein
MACTFTLIESVRTVDRSKKIPLAPSFAKGEAFELPPLEKEGWGGFYRACYFHR